MHLKEALEVGHGRVDVVLLALHFLVCNQSVPCQLMKELINACKL